MSMVYYASFFFGCFNIYLGHGSLKQQETAATICENLKENLVVSKGYEYYSGFFRGVLQAATQPNPLHIQSAATLLGVHRNSITNAATQYQIRSRGEEYTRFTARPKILRQRVSYEYAAYLTSLIKELTDPSANMDKVRRKRIAPGNFEEQVTHYRAETFHEMYQICVLDNADTEWCSLSFFIKQVPWYVIPKRLYNGLCYYHTAARHLVKQLLNNRNEWHEDCTCDCAYCDPTGWFLYIFFCYFITILIQIKLTITLKVVITEISVLGELATTVH